MENIDVCVAYSFVNNIRMRAEPCQIQSRNCFIIYDHLVSITILDLIFTDFYKNYFTCITIFSISLFVFVHLFIPLYSALSSISRRLQPSYGCPECKVVFIFPFSLWFLMFLYQQELGMLTLELGYWCTFILGCSMTLSICSTN